MKKILLDTNACSNYLRGSKDVLDALSRADIVYMSATVLGELFSGFKGGTKERWNKDILNTFLEKPTVSILNTTIETAEIFAEIKTSLKKTGTPLPINDIWIASHAFETGSVLITFDDHFKKIPGLRVWDISRQQD